MSENQSVFQRMRGMSKEFYIICALLYIFFVSWAGCYSLLAVWLNQFFKLTGSQVGFAYSVFSITALCLAPVYGMIQDKLILRRHLLTFVGVMMALCAPYYIFIVEPLLRTNVIFGGVAIGLYMGFAFNAGVGAVESYSERFSRIGGFEFGHARMFGALGWASAVAVTGVLLAINPHYNFYISTGAGLIFLALVALLNKAKTYSHDMAEDYKAGKNKKASIGEIISLAKLPAFWAVIVYVMGSSIYGVYDQQFQSYFVSLYDDPAIGAEMYGYLNSTQVFLEAACTFLAPFVVNKIGAKNGLLLASTIMFTRIGLSGLVDSTWAICAVKMLHAPEVPMVLISFFKYITSRFNPAISATVYLVAFVMTSQIISAALAPVAGYFYDTIGFADTYVMMSVIVIITTVISFFTLSSKELYTTKDHSADKEEDTSKKVEGDKSEADHTVNNNVADLRN